MSTDATRRGYDTVAPDYAHAVSGELADKPLDRGLLDAFASLVGGGAVVDLGCGPGHVAAYLRTRGTDVVGLDLSPAMCAITRRSAGVPACAADMTVLPVKSRSLAGVVCCYAVIHLDDEARCLAYEEIARVLRDGGHALIAFHTSDADTPSGQSKLVHEWWGHEVELTFRFLDADAEVQSLSVTGLDLVARLDREPHEGVEHPSRRSYLLVRQRHGDIAAAAEPQLMSW